MSWPVATALSVAMICLTVIWSARAFGRAVGAAVKTPHGAGASVNPDGDDSESES